MIDPDGFFIKLFPTVWDCERDQEDVEGAWREIGLPEEDMIPMSGTELYARFAAARTLRIVEYALSQLKKIREDRDRDFQRNHR